MKYIAYTMTLDPWANIAGGTGISASGAEPLIGGINKVLLTIGWSGAIVSVLISAMLIMSKSAKNRTEGKERLKNTMIAVLCISSLTFIVSTVVAIARSL